LKLELRRVAPIRAANILALFYAATMLLFSVPVFVGFSLIPGPATSDPQQPQAIFSAFRWVLVIYPVFGLIFGWVGGWVGAHLYNFIAGRIGGLQFECLSPSTPSTPAA
jgi:hypothetical protein